MICLDRSVEIADVAGHHYEAGLACDPYHIITICAELPSLPVLL